MVEIQRFFQHTSKYTKQREQVTTSNENKTTWKKGESVLTYLMKRVENGIFGQGSS